MVSTKKKSKKSTKSKERQYIDNNIIFKFTHKKKLPENEKIKKTLETFASFLQKYCELIQQREPNFPTLKITNSQLIKKPNQTNMYYIFVYTMPYNNHPFIIYGNFSFFSEDNNIKNIFSLIISKLLLLSLYDCDLGLIPVNSKYIFNISGLSKILVLL